MAVEDVVVQDVVARYIEILQFPANNPEYIPSLIPLFVGLVVLEVYFGRYEYENLGWNSAVSNSTLLLTTGLTLIYRLNLLEISQRPQFIVAYGILALGGVILLLNFYHLWPEFIAFNVSSSFVTYTSVYLAIAIVYEGMPLGYNTVAAAGGVLLTLFIVFRVLKAMENTVIPNRMRSNPAE